MRVRTLAMETKALLFPPQFNITIGPGDEASICMYTANAIVLWFYATPCVRHIFHHTYMYTFQLIIIVHVLLITVREEDWLNQHSADERNHSDVLHNTLSKYSLHDLDTRSVSVSMHVFAYYVCDTLWIVYDSENIRYNLFVHSCMYINAV